MVTLENATIVGLTANDALCAQFPFLMSARQNLNRGGFSPSCCGKSQSSGVNFNAIKQQIASLPLEAKLTFKKLTGWDQVRIILPGMQIVTF